VHTGVLSSIDCHSGATDNQFKRTASCQCGSSSNWHCAWTKFTLAVTRVHGVLSRNVMEEERIRETTKRKMVSSFQEGFRTGSVAHRKSSAGIIKSLDAIQRYFYSRWACEGLDVKRSCVTVRHTVMDRGSTCWGRKKRQREYFECIRHHVNCPTRRGPE
jgi:hypothetical protein